MPFDPAQPANNSALSSQVMRDQLNGLKALIDAFVSLTGAQVDGVTTLLPGEAATVGLTVSANTLHFTFGIPRGDEGVPGAQGIQGPPFAQAIMDAVTTLQPNDPATVLVSFDGANVHFSFGIPQGQPGQAGTSGNDGGIGPAGEVSLAQLTTAISGTSANSNGVATMDTAFVNDPPTLADLELMRAKMNELITTMRR